MIRIDVGDGATIVIKKVNGGYVMPQHLAGHDTSWGELMTADEVLECLSYWSKGREPFKIGNIKTS